MTQVDTPYKAVEFIIKNAPEHAKAKARRRYLEEFRKSKKAMLMKEALERKIEAVNAQEREAYSNPEYIELLKGLAEAIEIEENLSWQMQAAKIKTEIWRTEQANNRVQDGVTL